MNKIGRARFYLVKAGLIDGKTQGRWTLASKGQAIELTAESALAVFKDVRTRFKMEAPASDDEASPEL